MLLWDPSDWPKPCLGFGILGDGDKRVPEVMAEEMRDICAVNPLSASLERAKALENREKCQSW